MIKFLCKRLLQSVLIIWGVLTVVFILIHLAPGDPTSIYIRPDIDPKIVQDIRHNLGLDLPLWKQYLVWIPHFFMGDFGVSFVHHRPVTDILRETIPNTLQLTLVVFVSQFIIGILLGIYLALKHNSRLASALNALLFFIYSLPGFWLALMAIMLFSLKLGWLPSSHMQSTVLENVGWVEVLLDRIKHLILPAGVLILPFSAYTARYVSTSFKEIMQTEYIRAAYAFGLPEKKIWWKYALKNALLPQATLIGLYFPFLLGGAVITEYIFSWPGMGRLAINAIFSHDFPVILSCTLMATVAVVVGNLLSDILYSIIDPRIRYSGR